jgi:branched-subunit amino acid aminotransferase/4-amino-4-deoxychorismate lyase
MVSRFVFQCLTSSPTFFSVLPKIEANLYGAADALMLDTEGFVSETNATNVFLVKDGKLLTPHADYCLPGWLFGCIVTRLNLHYYRYY